ncbi:hypothetical protein COLO4_04909 [Corchorus olitorius]|uniref:Uncharacterized protein n=1 Tax=Corchorus olitorius TaxID=93759 RepID=A0A1R3KSI3_9ROSI|nr:hypothetical protein COLO4_04909 [Corchorus olitorius]
METKPSAKGVAEGACTNLKCLHLESLLQPIRGCQIDVLEMHGECKIANVEMLGGVYLLN